MTKHIDRGTSIEARCQVSLSGQPCCRTWLYGIKARRRWRRAVRSRWQVFPYRPGTPASASAPAGHRAALRALTGRHHRRRSSPHSRPARGLQAVPSSPGQSGHGDRHPTTLRAVSRHTASKSAAKVRTGLRTALWSLGCTVECAESGASFSAPDSAPNALFKQLVERP